MAAPRKSAQQLAAREKARAKAQELTERHEKLIDLAAEFFEQQEQAEQIPSPEPRVETPARVIAPSSRLTGSQTKFRAYGLAWLAAGARH